MQELILSQKNRDKVATKRRIRKNQILRAIRDRGTISFTEIAEITRFSLPMVSDLTKELMEENFVIPASVQQLRVGRPPHSIRLNPDAAYILGIDIGRTVTNLVLINLLQEIVCDLNLPTVNLLNQHEILDYLDNEIEQILEKSAIPRKKLIGIGIAIPGLVNSKTGNSYSYLNFGEKSTREVFEERLNIPVFIENDVKAMALGEMGFGLAQKIKNAACINLGWGIGLSLILNGAIYYGKSGFAGELGHITVEDNGPLCTCGRRGCLEALASGRAIGEIARKLLRSGSESQIKYSMSNLDEVDEETINEFARHGDQFSIEILQEAGYKIGKSIGELINIFNPELIILGGRGSKAGDFILYPIRTAALRHSLVELSRDVKIVCSKLGSKAGCLGATTLVTKELFETSHIDVHMYV